MTKTTIIFALLAALAGCASDLPTQEADTGMRYDPYPTRPAGYEDYCARHPDVRECGGYR